MAVSPESKMRLPDRVLVIQPIEGKPLATNGIMDKRLFTGENKLHAVMDSQTSLWKLKYDMGGVPSALTGVFTSFAAAKKHAQDYFKSRNVEIVEVID